MTDLLATLKADRKYHRPFNVDPQDCECVCGLHYPCPTARALDCAIALAEYMEPVRGVYVSQRYRQKAMDIASRAYEGTHAEEE